MSIASRIFGEAFAAEKVKEVRKNAGKVINNLPKYDLASPGGVRKAVAATNWVLSRSKKKEEQVSSFSRTRISEDRAKGHKVADISADARLNINRHFARTPHNSMSSDPYKTASHNLKWSQRQQGMTHRKKLKTLGNKINKVDLDYYDDESAKIIRPRNTAGGRHIVKKHVGESIVAEIKALSEGLVALRNAVAKR